MSWVSLASEFHDQLEVEIHGVLTSHPWVPVTFKHCTLSRFNSWVFTSTLTWRAWNVWSKANYLGTRHGKGWSCSSTSIMNVRWFLLINGCKTLFEGFWQDLLFPPLVRPLSKYEALVRFRSNLLTTFFGILEVIDLQREAMRRRLNGGNGHMPGSGIAVNW